MVSLGEIQDALKKRHALGLRATAFAIQKPGPNPGVRDFKMTGLLKDPIDCHVKDTEPPPKDRIVLCTILWDQPKSWVTVCHDGVQSNSLYGYANAVPAIRGGTPLFARKESIAAVEDWANFSGASAHVMDTNDYLGRLNFLHARGRGAKAFSVEPVNPAEPFRHFFVDGLANERVTCVAHDGAQPGPDHKVLCNLRWRQRVLWVTICHVPGASNLDGFVSQVPTVRKGTLPFVEDGGVARVADWADFPPETVMDTGDYLAQLEAFHARGRGATAFSVEPDNPDDPFGFFHIAGLGKARVPCALSHDAQPGPQHKVLCNFRRETRASWVTLCHLPGSTTLDGFSNAFPAVRKGTLAFTQVGTATRVADWAEYPPEDVAESGDYVAQVEAFHARGRGAEAFGVHPVESGPNVGDFHLSGLRKDKRIFCKVDSDASPGPRDVVLCAVRWGADRWVVVFHTPGSTEFRGRSSQHPEPPLPSPEPGQVVPLLFERVGEVVKAIDYGDVPRQGPVDIAELSKRIGRLHLRGAAEHAFRMKHDEQRGGYSIDGLTPTPLFAVHVNPTERTAGPNETPLFRVREERGQWVAVYAGRPTAGQTPFFAYRPGKHLAGLRFLLPEVGDRVYPEKLPAAAPGSVDGATASPAQTT